MRKIGIIGGTFDPPHYGHLLIANEVYHALNLEEVWFLLNQIPPHKQGRNITSVESRLHMLELATEAEEHFSICLEELSRKGPSYTYDTMLQLTKKYPDVQFHFIIGGDMVEYLPKWYNIEALLNLVTFVELQDLGIHCIHHIRLLQWKFRNLQFLHPYYVRDIRRRKRVNIYFPKSTGIYREEWVV